LEHDLNTASLAFDYRNRALKQIKEHQHFDTAHWRSICDPIVGAHKHEPHDNPNNPPGPVNNPNHEVSLIGMADASHGHGHGLV
jgi:hypothetical protein